MVYKKEYLEAFLKNQSQLFDEPVAETLEEADAFLDDCMAVVADSFKDVKDYFEENGMDTAGLTKESRDRCDGKFDFQPECHGSGLFDDGDRYGAAQNRMGR